MGCRARGYIRHCRKRNGKFKKCRGKKKRVTRRKGRAYPTNSGRVYTIDEMNAMVA